MPRDYACIKQYQSTSPPPVVDRDRFAAVNKQWNAKKNQTKCEKYLVQRILTRGLSKVSSVSRCEILASIPTILKSS